MGVHDRITPASASAYDHLVRKHFNVYAVNRVSFCYVFKCGANKPLFHFMTRIAIRIAYKNFTPADYIRRYTVVTPLYFSDVVRRFPVAVPFFFLINAGMK